MRIVSALKKRVKGRVGVDDEFVDVQVLAAELNLPIGWLKNAMEARLLEHVFGERMALRYDTVFIGVPPTFASDRIEID